MKPQEILEHLKRFIEHNTVGIMKEEVIYKDDLEGFILIHERYLKLENEQRKNKK